MIPGVGFREKKAVRDHRSRQFGPIGVKGRVLVVVSLSMKRRGPEALILCHSVWVGRCPVRDQMAHESIILRSRCGRKMGDPGIDPPDRIRYIGTIDRDLVAV